MAADSGPTSSSLPPNLARATVTGLREPWLPLSACHVRRLALDPRNSGASHQAHCAARTGRGVLHTFEQLGNSLAGRPAQLVRQGVAPTPDVQSLQLVTKWADVNRNLFGQVVDCPWLGFVPSRTRRRLRLTPK